MDPLWSDTESVTMYSFDPEGRELTGTTPTRSHLPLDSGGAESQDSRLVYASVTEVDVKEHTIDETRPGPSRGSRKTSNRDPRRRSVTVAPPTSLFGVAMSHMSAPSNVSEGTFEATQPILSLMEDSDGEPPMVIDIINIESE